MSLLLSLFVAVTSAWGIEIPDNLPESHPRVLTTENGRSETLDLIEREAWAKDIYQRLKSRTDKYIDRGEDGLVSCLQMYWKSHTTDALSGTPQRLGSKAWRMRTAESCRHNRFCP